MRTTPSSPSSRRPRPTHGPAPSPFGLETASLRISSGRSRARPVRMWSTGTCVTIPRWCRRFPAVLYRVTNSSGIRTSASIRHYQATHERKRVGTETGRPPPRVRSARDAGIGVTSVEPTGPTHQSGASASSLSSPALHLQQTQGWLVKDPGSKGCPHYPMGERPISHFASAGYPRTYTQSSFLAGMWHVLQSVV